MLNLYLKGKISNWFYFWNISFVYFRLVDIILEKMSDAPEDPSGSAGQGNNAYGSQPGAYNKGTTRLTVNDQQPKGNQCQC